MDIFDFLDDIAKSCKDPVFFEVGTHDGYHTNLINNVIKKFHKSYRYFAFEPDSRSHASFQNNNRNHLHLIKFYFAAIGRSVGKTVFHLSDGFETRPNHTPQRFNGSSSIIKPKHVLTAWPDMKFREETVEITTIDKVAYDNKLTHIDFIWADVQGAEEEMILGFGLMKENIHYLYTEYCNSELYENEPSLSRIHELLGSDWKLIKDFGGDALFENTKYANDYYHCK